MTSTWQRGVVSVLLLAVIAAGVVVRAADLDSPAARAVEITSGVLTLIAIAAWAVDAFGRWRAGHRPQRPSRSDLAAGALGAAAIAVVVIGLLYAIVAVL